MRILAKLQKSNINSIFKKGSQLAGISCALAIAVSLLLHAMNPVDSAPAALSMALNALALSASI